MRPIADAFAIEIRRKCYRFRQDVISIPKLQQLRQVVLKQIANALKTQVCGGVGSQNLWIQRVVALPHEDGGDLQTPAFFYSGQQAQFVLDQYVMFGLTALGDIGKFLFFMKINQDLTGHRFRQSGGIQLVRLEDYITVGEQSRRPSLLDVRDNLKRIRKETVSKRIVE